MSTQPSRIGKNRCKEWFQTFPSWNNSSREAILDLLKGLDIQSATIAQESHEDGTPHYHAQYVLTLKKSKPQLVKYFKINLPDDYKRCTTMRALEPAKSAGHCANYLSKEDDDVLSYWAPPNIALLNKYCNRIGVPDYETLQSQLYRTRCDERICSAALAAYHSGQIFYSLDPEFLELLELFSGSYENISILKMKKGVDIVDIFIQSCKDLVSIL